MKVLAFTLAFVFLCSGRILAEQDKKASKPKDSEKQEQKASKLVLDNIEIEGRIEKPQTVFILPGRDTAVDDILIDRSFFKEIFRQIDKDQLSDAAVRKDGNSRLLKPGIGGTR
jgi:hypothetical protein